MERKIKKTAVSKAIWVHLRTPHYRMEPDRGFLTSRISDPERIDRPDDGDTLRGRRMFAERMHRYQYEPIRAIRTDICLPGTTSQVQLTMASGAIRFSGQASPAIAF